MGRGRAKFSPAMVPEVRNGFFWVPGQRVSGLGTTAFRWEEGNQKSVADQIQTTVAKQPAQIVSNGIPAWSVVGAVDVPGSDIRMITAGNVTAGWTDNTYLAMWQRFPGVGTANLLPTGVTVAFAHNLITGNQRRLLLTHSGSNETYNMTVSTDGTNVQTNVWDASADYPDPNSPNLWLWKEWLYTAGVGVAMYVNLILRAPSSENINVASLFDAAAPIALFAATGASVNQNHQQCGMAVYCPGIPSLKSRKRLANMFNPAGTKFSV